MGFYYESQCQSSKVCALKKCTLDTSLKFNHMGKVKKILHNGAVYPGSYPVGPYPVRPYPVSPYPVRPYPVGSYPGHVTSGACKTNHPNAYAQVLYAQINAKTCQFQSPKMDVYFLSALISLA